MADLTPAQAAEIRGELADLRDECNRRLKELEERLETRIAAAERKHLTDLEHVNEQIGALVKHQTDTRRDVGNVDSLVRANHLAEIHLWGVTARLLKLPEPEIRDAQQHARKLLDGATDG